MIADVVGFSRLMRSNEVGTLQTLKAHQSELIDDRISSHSGRVIKRTGDGFIAEFSSVTNAANCAVEIQSRMRVRNQDVPKDRCIEFRIGLNAGDIIHDGDDVFGDGVNLAARIEAFAQPGGVAVSGPTREQIGKCPGLAFRDAGRQHLKNIDQPVQLFHLELDETGSTQPVSTAPSNHTLAVLPFVNMSGDTEQEFFADGMTEDLITDLSKIPDLFVVGRNSVFAYKGKSGDLVRIARELGVKFILEGSVRKSGPKVRVSAQFIDGATGGHLWADRYDRELTDAFELQDEITGIIVGQLKLQLQAPRRVGGEDNRRTRNLDAYSCYLKGRHFYHMRTRQMLAQGREMFEQAVRLDPGFARAYAGIADCDSFMNSWFGARVPVQDILETTNKAIQLEPDLAEAHAAQGFALQTAGRIQDAGGSFERALAIDPLCYEAHYYLARLCVVKELPDRAAEHFVRALEIRPDDYRSPLLLDSVLGKLDREEDREAYVQLGLKRAENTVALHPQSSDPLELGAAVLATRKELPLARHWLNRALEIKPEEDTQTYNIACAYVGLGEPDKAIEVLEKVLNVAGPDALEWIKADPDMDPIRDHPRFVQMIQR